MPVTSKPWTPADTETARQMRANGATHREIADALGRSWASVKCKTQQENWPLGLRPEHLERKAGIPTAPPDPSVPPPDPVQVQREKMERVRLHREEHAALTALAGEKSLRTALESIIRDVVPQYPAPPPYKAPATARGETVQESAILCLSDWHWGEVVDAERTRGFNEYSPVIAERRSRAVFAAARSILTGLQRGGWRWNRLVASVNGDMLTGTIHDLERHADGRNIVQSTYEVAMLLAELLRDYSTLAPHLDVYFTSGNHGRMAPKQEAKDPLRNWDAVCGLFVKTALAGCPNIRVEVPNSYGCAFELEGHTFVQTHGHQIKGGSFGGLPWYGINRMVTNYNALEASRGGRVAAWLLAHFHQAASIPNVSSEIFINGSLISGTEWTIDTLGKNDRPCQWLLGVHRQHGISHRWPLFAEPGTAGVADAA